VKWSDDLYLRLIPSPSMVNCTAGRRVGVGQLYMTSEMRLEVLTALSMKTVPLRGVAPCSLV